MAQGSLWRGGAPVTVVSRRVVASPRDAIEQLEERKPQVTCCAPHLLPALGQLGEPHRPSVWLVFAQVHTRIWKNIVLH